VAVLMTAAAQSLLTAAAAESAEIYIEFLKNV